MRWFFICLLQNLATTAYSFPDDSDLFFDQAGPAASSVLNDNIDETRGINGFDLDEAILGDDTAFNGVMPEDILFDSPTAGLDRSNTLSSNPSGGCLSPISKIRARAGACPMVKEEAPQVDQDTTRAESLRRNENTVLDKDRAVLQDVPIDQEASAAPGIVLAQNVAVNQDPPGIPDVPLNQDSPITPDMPLFPDLPLIQDRPAASEISGATNTLVDQNKPVISDNQVGLGTVVAQDVPVVQDVPEFQDLPLEQSLSWNEDLTSDDVTTYDIRQYWCSEKYGLGLDKIPVCNIDNDNFDSDQLLHLFFRGISS